MSTIGPIGRIRPICPILENAAAEAGEGTVIEFPKCKPSDYLACVSGDCGHDRVQDCPTSVIQEADSLWEIASKEIERLTQRVAELEIEASNQADDLATMRTVFLDDLDHDIDTINWAVNVCDDYCQYPKTDEAGEGNDE